MEKLQLLVSLKKIRETVIEYFVEGLREWANQEIILDNLEKSLTIMRIANDLHARLKSLRTTIYRLQPIIHHDQLRTLKHSYNLWRKYEKLIIQKHHLMKK